MELRPVQGLLQDLLGAGANRAKEELRIEIVGQQEKRRVRQVHLELAGRVQRLFVVVRKIEKNDARMALAREEETAPELEALAHDLDARKAAQGRLGPTAILLVLEDQEDGDRVRSPRIRGAALPVRESAPCVPVEGHRPLLYSTSWTP